MKHIAVALHSYEGDTSSLVVTPDPMFIVVKLEGEHKTTVVDYGYSTLDELKDAWPDVETEIIST